jgi:hypothetical protein
MIVFVNTYALVYEHTHTHTHIFTLSHVPIHVEI